MNTYTVIAYVVPAGGHHVETVPGINATDAVIRLRERLGLQQAELEIVGVTVGIVRFTLVDASAVALAPYCPACHD
ncbi:MAG: hypothetical protein U1F61_08870 [Opitutaceae bacterium]|jgi:hypothetical protein